MAISELPIRKKPPWLKVRFPTHKNYFHVAHLLKEEGLCTICQSAKCPNIAECWTQKTATFLILGDICTRNCAFCAVKKGSPLPVADSEAMGVARAARYLGLKYVVVTSVTRDDLADRGASYFVETINHLKAQGETTVDVEVLIPDFNGRDESLLSVLRAGPAVLNHNLEVPENLYTHINRPRENYARSLKLLELAKKLGAVTKSGIMVGLGEDQSNIHQTLADLRSIGCELLTIGQYLQPTKRNIPVRKYYSPEEFDELKHTAQECGFKAVEAGPLVRSSFNAHLMYQNISRQEA